MVEQLDIFTLTKIKRNDVVTVKMLSEMVNEEDKDYFEYHKKHLLGAKGVVLNVNELLNGISVCEVFINGRKELIYDYELNILGGN